jgi:uncharacterized iron-regulated membrane protein
MRNLHRWLATIGMLFLLYVAVTGSILAISELLRGGPHLIAAPGGPRGGAPPPAPPTGAPGAGANEGRRDPAPRFDARGWPTNEFLQDIHSGAIFGAAGQWVDLATGITFVVLSITGPVMYFQMLRTRRKSGRTRAFWR